MSGYPTLQFLERYGSWLAVILALVPPIAAFAVLMAGNSPWWLPFGAVLGLFLFVAARSYIELIRLMTDMLLPK